MAIMIPDVPVATTATHAEVAVFRTLREALPDEFFVYHSVAYFLSGGRHHAPVEGEIDFLILHRELGLCAMEVKGGQVSYDGRKQAWTSMDRDGTTHTIHDPFLQAERGIFTIVREIEQRKILGGDPLPCAWSHCVALPDCHFDPTGAPSHCSPDLVIDCETLSDTKNRVTALMARQAGRRGKKSLTTRQRKLISQRLLAPRFQLGLTMQGEFAWEERSLRLLTEEQAVCLEFLALNPRAVVRAPAGTGKTVIALEHARRMADQGARTLLLCFNLPLAAHLRRASNEFEGLAGSIWAGAYHELCRDWAKQAGIPFDVPPESDPEAVTAFWDEDSSILFAQALERLNDRFDVLIVDEAQDMHDLWWEVLGELLAADSGGMVLMHDPEQNIYGRSGQLPLEGPVFPLRTNCRCTHMLGQYTGALAGVNCRTPLFAGGGEAPVIKAYASSEEQFELIEQRIAELLHSAVLPDQIIILGTHRQERSVLAGRAEVGGLPVVDFEEEATPPPSGSFIRYSTLHRFKGLESDVVLLCDVDGNLYSSTRRHVYVAASRAKHRLYIFCDGEALREHQWIRQPCTSAPPSPA